MSGLETALAVASFGFNVIGKIHEAQSAAAQEEANAAANEANAKIARQNADIASSQANAAEEGQRRKARQILGTQRASLAQSGMGLGPTAQDIYSQSAALAELDALNIRYEGQVNRTGYLNQAGIYDYEAASNKVNASRLTTQGYIGAAGEVGKFATSKSGSKVLSSASNYLWG